MVERASDRWVGIFLSVLLHAGVVGLAVYGWWMYQHRPKPPAPTLAIEATVVDARTLRGTAPPAPPPPKPAPTPAPPPPPEEQGPPAPTPAELAQREKAVREAEEAKQKQKQEEEQRQAQERAKAAQEAEQAKRKAEEERLAEQKRQEVEKRKAEEERLRAQREADLRHSLAREEEVMAATSSGALASWTSQIQARIQRAWLRPPSARSGIDCTVQVTQVPGGEVTHVHVSACNGDQSVRESIEAAVYRASPLPPPPDPALFERNLEIEFKPVD